MITIKDIAEKAGVAKSTVSNVLNGTKYVSDEIKEKVLAICKENDYQPNFYASTLSAKKIKTNIIGLFLEETTKKYRKFYSSLIEGILTSLASSKKNLLIYNGLDKGETNAKLKNGTSPIDGAIILGPTINDTRIDEFYKNYIPFVLIGHPDNDTNINFVDTDNIGLTKNVTKMIINKGYNKICLINSNEKLVISKERNQGFKEAFKEDSTINPAIYYISNENQEAIEGYEYAKAALKKGYNAFITASGFVASGVYRACNEESITIGEDVVIFSLGYSYDDSLVFSPSLSYATQDYFKFGNLAGEQLLKLIDGKTESIKQTIESEIHNHESFKE